jgi:hypothetical protein
MAKEIACSPLATVFDEVPISVLVLVTLDDEESGMDSMSAASSAFVPFAGW